MGANQPGDIAELADIALPTHGLITNIGPAHLERLKSIEGVQKTKGALFDFLRANGGGVFLNKNDARVIKVAEGAEVIASFGTLDSDFSYEIVEETLSP